MMNRGVGKLGTHCLCLASGLREQSCGAESSICRVCANSSVRIELNYRTPSWCMQGARKLIQKTQPSDVRSVVSREMVFLYPLTPKLYFLWENISLLTLAHDPVAPLGGPQPQGCLSWIPWDSYLVVTSQSYLPANKCQEQARKAAVYPCGPAV